MVIGYWNLFVIWDLTRLHARSRPRETEILDENVRYNFEDEDDDDEGQGGVGGGVTAAP